jgi:hypothetical protein
MFGWNLTQSKLSFTLDLIDLESYVFVWFKYIIERKKVVFAHPNMNKSLIYQ